MNTTCTLYIFIKVHDNISCIVLENICRKFTSKITTIYEVVKSVYLRGGPPPHRQDSIFGEAVKRKRVQIVRRFLGTDVIDSQMKSPIVMDYGIMRLIPSLT